ncbi:MAG TPA: P-II family nitrogen regulator, partial [Baekduia sp.]|nr:P-II family nitrogen regulator [Baekduia sp.]
MTRIQGHGGEIDHVETYRGTSIKMVLSEKIRFEVAVSEDFVQKAIDAICEGARTGEVGDGKIFVMDLAQVVRIRTGETETDAV